MTRVGRVSLGMSVAAWLATAASGAEPAPATLYRDHCSACHGNGGEGMVGPPLKPLPIPAKDVRALVRQGSGQMPPFSPADLPDAALDALIAWLEAWR